MRQFNKYFTFLGLYIAQSIPMSFFTTVVPVIMRQENYSLELIGLLQFVKLPWVLKFLWAPIIDKKANTLLQYKRCIIASELFYAAIILSVGFFSLQTDFTLILVLIVLAIFASATQDIATDALAILSLRKDQQSMGNAIQSMGGFIGALVGSGVLLLIYNSFGWKALLIGLSCFVLIALIPLRFFNYELREKAKGNNSSIKSIVSFFAQKGITKHIIFLFFSITGLAGMMAMLKPYMVDYGFSLEKIGCISGILGTATAAVMAFVSGITIKRLGMKNSLILFFCLAIVVIGYFIKINHSGFSETELVIGICAFWGVYGMINVAIYTLAMGWARSGNEGTDFTIQLVINQLGALFIAGHSGIIAKWFNYQGLFIVELVLVSLILFYVIFVYKDGTRD